jgi:lipid kinase YegS
MSRATRKREFLFIMHGGRAELPALRHLVGWVREKGHRVDPRVTWERGDAERFARDGAQRGVDAVVALGGDGTVNEVLNGLDGSQVPLGIIPVGTANDFARQIGLPDDPDHAMDVILRRPAVRIDTASLNGRRFVNVSSGGVGAEATAETSSDAKESLGPLAYAITGVRKIADLVPSRATFSAPGLELDCEYLVFGVGNARSTGGGTLITPCASVTDGMLDVCIVESMPLTGFAKLVLKIRRGEHVGEEGVRYAQLPSLTIRAEAPIPVNADGEPADAPTLEYRARPRDLWIHAAALPGGETPR